MFSTDDTIVAIATPPGRGGIGVVRLSGPEAVAIARGLTGRQGFEPRHATLTRVSGRDGLPIDQAVVTHFPAPHSYTGDDVVEVSAHGSPVVLDAVLRAAVAAGARLANPGEFTFRAYLNGRIDLVQAEAVGELIEAVTPLQARVAFDQLNGTLTVRLREIDTALLDLIAPLEASLDFPEDGYHFITPAETALALNAISSSIEMLLAEASRGRMIREGLTAAIVGRPNAGKSSLFNRLAGAARAIVTDVPGTTRDLLTERVDIGGVPFTLVDTAGLRDGANDAIEEEGISRARQAVDAADLVVLVLDRSSAFAAEDRTLLHDTASRQRVIVASKSDLAPAWDAGTVGALEVSSLTDAGIDALRAALAANAGVGLPRDAAPIANLRHAALLERAHEAVARDGGGVGRRAGGIRARGSARRARPFRRDHGRPAAGRGAAGDLRALLYREVSKSLIGHLVSHHEVIVIGAGHAGVEAAWAAARMGRDVAICTLSMETIAHMPCNPAIGGTAKGHLVREIDALGGLMGQAIDETAIQFKLLNRSRGPAVWSPRAQADKRVYGAWVRAALEREPNISWIIGRAGRILVEGGRVSGLAMEDGDTHSCDALIVTTGTFLNGLVHVGRDQRPAGRAGEPPSRDLAESLKSFGFSWGRLKTGTPPRLHRCSIDFTRFAAERGDEQPVPFSFLTGAVSRPQIACHLVYTTERVHELVREHIGDSPLFNGQISGIGPRYCPSLEDKVMRFPHRERHQIFLEPEGLDADEIYVNGYSMSLPADIQAKIVHALPGLEEAEIIRPGYAVEYDFIQPTELDSGLQARRVPGLFLAGQINGTSGYEEAGAQGLLAGINAARSATRLTPVRIGRDEGYIGVLVDDLTTRGCLEPYRMFTSRAEHRLLLRIDNADLRLTPLGRLVGLVDDHRWSRFEARKTRLERNQDAVRATTVTVGGERVPADRALRQPGVDVRVLAREGQLLLDIDDPAVDFTSLETFYRYEGYLRRQGESVERLKRQESRVIPANFQFEGIPGLSRESVERLTSVRPETVGQALRIPGLTAAAVALVAAHVSGHLTR